MDDTPQDHPTSAGASQEIVLKRIDDAHQKLDQSLKALKLSDSGARARDELIGCIGAAVLVAEKVTPETSGPDIIRLMSDLAARLERASIDKFTHRLDPFGSRTTKQMREHQEKIQFASNQLMLRLLSFQPNLIPSPPPLPGPSGGTTAGTEGEETLRKPSDNRPYQSPKWIELLGPTKKILSGVSQASSAIPVVGQYVQLGVGAATALIDMITGMDDNDANGQTLCDNADRFARMVDTFNQTISENVSQGELKAHFGSFREQCDSIRRKVEEIRAQFSGRKILTSSTNASTIAELEKKIDMAWKELDLCINLDTNRKVAAQERAYYFDLLGDADYGHVGHLKNDGCCLDGTRGEVLETIDTWADDPSSPHVLLLKGQAGRGKSSIARSSLWRFRARWKDDTSSAIFHFRYDKSTLENRVILALARQLAEHEEAPLGKSILRSIKENKGVGSCLEDHFKILLGAFRKLESGTPRVLLVIDALDECKDPKLVSTLLRLIADHSSSLPPSVKFLFTSRPEDHILQVFQAFKAGDKDEEDLDTVESRFIRRDLFKFFSAEFSQILEDRGDRILKVPRLKKLWQAEATVPRLVKLSEDLFQWANAAINYVKKAPEINLEKLIGPSGVKCGLPDLYRRILLDAFPLDANVPDPDFDRLIQHVLGSLVASSQTMTPSILGYLRSESADVEASMTAVSEIRAIIDPLRSMLMIPIDNSPDSPIRFMHTSVRDFLTNPDQCKDPRFLIDEATQHARLAALCFDRMKRDLRHDICQINDPSKTNAEISNIEKQRISPGLLYCCRAWANHLSEVKHGGKIDCSGVHIQLGEFCATQLLYWLEVLSLCNVLPEVYEMIHHGKEWTENTNCAQCKANSPTPLLLVDLNEFCRRFFHLVSTHGQHTALSYLLHFPKETTLRHFYEPLMGPVPRIIRGPTHQQSGWPRVLFAGSGVRCVALSPDGKTLASGSDNGVIYLWDVENGLQKGKPLAGHDDLVGSIAFSPDGKLLASGSTDKTVLLWDIESGLPRGDPLVGHHDSVNAVAFSPYGRMLASGSGDETIRLWDIESGLQKGKTLKGHGSWVLSLAFSRNGKVLVSGSGDKTLRLWDTETGLQKGEPVVGHSEAVRSVAFSPDGKMFTSGSDDNTVRLWDLETGEQKGKPLKGHTNAVYTVTFSPKDGTMLASGSYDGSIRLWDVKTGLQNGEPLIGHGGTVWSVTFSPNGKLLASGSWDKTIRLWDIEHRHQEDKLPNGHDGPVRSIALSSDGKILASGSADKTVRLWDIETGHQKGEPLLGHTGAVLSIAFSADGKVLASVSKDRTIRLWDVKRGLQKGEPLVGHGGAVLSVAFSADGKVLASGSDDKTVRLWDVKSRLQKGNSLINHSGRVYSISFSPDGKILASGSKDKTICLWDIETGLPRGKLLIGHNKEIKTLAFSPDGQILASGSDDRTLCLWDVKSGLQKGYPLVGHNDSVFKVAFSSDGKTLTSDSRRERISWNIATSADELHNGSNPGDKDPSTSLNINESLLKSSVREFHLGTEAAENGWVHLRGKRCVWLPDKFYIDPSNGWLCRVFVLGNVLVFNHPNVYILDISALL